jgi:hypothetical protein
VTRAEGIEVGRTGSHLVVRPCEPQSTLLICLASFLIIGWAHSAHRCTHPDKVRPAFVKESCEHLKTATTLQAALTSITARHKSGHWRQHTRFGISIILWQEGASQMSLHTLYVTVRSNDQNVSTLTNKITFSRLQSFARLLSALAIVNITYLQKLQKHTMTNHPTVYNSELSRVAKETNKRANR